MYWLVLWWELEGGGGGEELRRVGVGAKGGDKVWETYWTQSSECYYSMTEILVTAYSNNLFLLSYIDTYVDMIKNTFNIHTILQRCSNINSNINSSKNY